MKKALALLLSLVFTLAAHPVWGEEAKTPPAYLDMSPFADSPDTFQIDVSEDGSFANVQVRVDDASRAYFPDADAPSWYCMIYPVLSVTDYAEEQKRMPILCIRLRYRGKKALNISSVSFTGGSPRREYRFTGITSPDGVSATENGEYQEDLMIFCGSNPGTAAFFSGILSDSTLYSYSRYAEKGSKDYPLPSWNLILHGDEDLDIRIPDIFWSELGMFGTVFMVSDSFSLLSSLPGSDCEMIGLE